MAEYSERTIVYIEDDPEMIGLVSVILSPRGFHVKGAPAGRQGLDLILSEKPDLVLLDLMMPDMDGWEIYHQIRTGAETKSLPVIVITAKTQTIDRVLGMNIAGVDDYICKPFHPQELLDSLDRVLSKQSTSTSTK